MNPTIRFRVWSDGRDRKFVTGGRIAQIIIGMAHGNLHWPGADILELRERFSIEVDNGLQTLLTPIEILESHWVLSYDCPAGHRRGLG